MTEREIRADERLEAIRDVCRDCRTGDRPEWEESRGRYVHEWAIPGTLHTMRERCPASSIWIRHQGRGK